MSGTTWANSRDDTVPPVSGWAVLVGGSGGALHVTFCPGNGAETAPRHSVPERSSSTSQAGPPSRRPIRPKRSALSPLLAQKREA
jgi:hypothetical protein